MTIKQAILQAVEAFDKAGVPDPRIDAELILCHLTGLDRMSMLMQGATELTSEQEQRFSSLLLSRTQRKPLQYLLGTQVFYGLDFQVDSRVLIPRQETETLCEWGINHLRSLKKPNVKALDLCTGSGAIAITLKHECPHADVTAADLSMDALAVASSNAKLNQTDIRFVQGDLWQPVEGEVFDLILSNPPYIPTHDCDTLQQEVMQEPRMALDGGLDGLDFYRRIANGALSHLSSDGMIAVEVGIGEAQDVSSLFTNAGLIDVQIIKDLYGVERIVSARRRSEDHV